MKRDQTERDKLVNRQLDEKRDHLKRQHNILQKAQQLGRDLKNDLKNLRENRRVIGQGAMVLRDRLVETSS